MRTLILILLALLLLGCSTKRNVQTTTVGCTDSISSTVSARSDSVGTELLTSMYVNFDSIEVDVIPRDSAIRSIRLKARRASYTSSKYASNVHTSAEAKVDTTATHRTLAQSAKDSSESTKVAKPPNIGIIGLIVLLVSFVILCNRIKK